MSDGYTHIQTVKHRVREKDCETKEKEGENDSETIDCFVTKPIRVHDRSRM